MIILNITYHVKAGKRDAFLSAIEALNIPALTNAEKGCLAYDYYYPIHNTDDLFLNEIWEDEDCLKAHTLTEHFFKLQELKSTLVDTVTITKYRAEALS